MTAAQLLHSALEKYATQPGATTGMKPPSAPAAPTGGLNTGGLNKGLGAGLSPAGGGLAKPPALTAPQTTTPQRWAFDRPGSGDAQARQAIYNWATGGGSNAAQAAPPAAPAPSTPLVSPPAPAMTLSAPSAQPQPAPATPPAPQITGNTQPQPIVSNTQGTLTDTAGQPLPTTPEQPKGPEAFVAGVQDRSAGKEPTGGVIDMTKPLDTKAVEAHLGDVNVPPEQKQKFLGTLTEKLKNENPQYYEGFHDMQAGRTDTEAAKAYQGRMEQAKNELIQQAAQADPQKASTPQGYGEIVNNAMSTFQNMHPAMQAMVGIGLPVGLIGIMSSMFGEGGMGMGILGALGLGAGVLGGAAGGMFGQGAQNMAGDAAYQVGSFLGMAPEARSGSLDALRGDDALTRMTAGPSQDDQTAAFNDPAGHAKKVQQQLDQAGQVRKLMSLPEGMRPQFLRNIDPSLSEEDAVIAARNAAQFSTQMDEPDSAVSKMLQQGQEFVANPHEVVNQKADEHIRGKLPWGTQWAAPAIRSGYQWWNNIPSGPQEDAVKGASVNINNLIEKWAFNDMDAKELSDLKAEQAKGAPYRVEDARRERELTLRNQAEAPARPTVKKKLVVMCMKSARCWAGYEPVPGKAPYSEDSCRPAGSKKKKTEKKKSPRK